MAKSAEQQVRSAEQKVRSVVTHFWADADRGDWAQACAFTTREVPPQCGLVLRTAAPGAFVPGSHLAFAKVVLSGQVAVVTYSDGQRTRLTELRGEWFISGGYA